MLSRLPLARWSARLSGRAAPSTPDGMVVYAIGDVHGRADLLEVLLEAVLQDAAGQDGALVVGLGDYVDRGPESRRVVDLLLALKAEAGLSVRLLKGNHDQSLIDFLRTAETGPQWCRFGGRETLFSYGVTPPATRRDMEEWQSAQAEFRARLPAAHRDLFDQLELSFSCGDYFFAHAGARPEAPLDAQSARDLMWIRAPFLADRRWLGKMVVHGHTPAEAIHMDHRRIGLDTGAYQTGVLSACRFDGSTRRALQAISAEGERPAVRWRPL